MPAARTSEGFGDRNKQVGAIWKGYSDEQRLVFSLPYFYALLGIPEFNDDSDEFDIAEPHPTLHPISQEDRELLEPIYHQLVDVAKVRANLGNASSALSGPAARAAAQKDFRKISNDVISLLLSFSKIHVVSVADMC